MNVITMHSNEADQARWAGLWDRHPWGLIGAPETTRCCLEGHADPTAAIAHAAERETTVLTGLVERLPDGSWGREVLNAHRDTP